MCLRRAQERCVGSPGRDRDRRPASGSLLTLSSWERLESQQSGDVAVADAVTERGRPLGVRAIRRAGSMETSVRPASASVGAATSGKEPTGRHIARTIRGVRTFPCCVIVFAIVVWQCYFATELVICCVARGLISSTTDLVIFSQVLILYFVLVVCMLNLLLN